MEVMAGPPDPSRQQKLDRITGAALSILSSSPPSSERPRSNLSKILAPQAEAEDDGNGSGSGSGRSGRGVTREESESMMDEDEDDGEKGRSSSPDRPRPSNPGKAPLRSLPSTSKARSVAQRASHTPTLPHEFNPSSSYRTSSPSNVGRARAYSTPVAFDADRIQQTSDEPTRKIHSHAAIPQDSGAASSLMLPSVSASSASSHYRHERLLSSPDSSSTSAFQDSSIMTDVHGGVRSPRSRYGSPFSVSESDGESAGMGEGMSRMEGGQDVGGGAGGSGGSGGYRNESGMPKKRTRTLTTSYQTAVLTALLAETRFPSTETRIQVGREIGMSARRVQIWFQNRRQGEKRLRERSKSFTSSSYPPTTANPPTQHYAHGYSQGQSSGGSLPGPSRYADVPPPRGPGRSTMHVPSSSGSSMYSVTSGSVEEARSRASSFASTSLSGHSKAPSGTFSSSTSSSSIPQYEREPPWMDPAASGFQPQQPQQPPPSRIFQPGPPDPFAPSHSRHRFHPNLPPLTNLGTRSAYEVSRTNQNTPTTASIFGNLSTLPESPRTPMFAGSSSGPSTGSQAPTYSWRSHPDVSPPDDTGPYARDQRLFQDYLPEPNSMNLDRRPLSSSGLPRSPSQLSSSSSPHSMASPSRHRPTALPDLASETRFHGRPRGFTNPERGPTLPPLRHILAGVPMSRPGGGGADSDDNRLAPLKSSASPSRSPNLGPVSDVRSSRPLFGPGSPLGHHSPLGSEGPPLRGKSPFLRVAQTRARSSTMPSSDRRHVLAYSASNHAANSFEDLSRLRIGEDEDRSGRYNPAGSSSETMIGSSLSPVAYDLDDRDRQEEGDGRGREARSGDMAID